MIGFKKLGVARDAMGEILRRRKEGKTVEGLGGTGFETDER